MRLNYDTLADINIPTDSGGRVKIALIESPSLGEGSAIVWVNDSDGYVIANGTVKIPAEGMWDYTSTYGEARLSATRGLCNHDIHIIINTIYQLIQEAHSDKAEPYYHKVGGYTIDDEDYPLVFQCAYKLDNLTRGFDCLPHHKTEAEAVHCASRRLMDGEHRS